MRIGNLDSRGVGREDTGPLELRPGAGPRGAGEWAGVFGRPGALKIEVGPGKGDWLRKMAAREPETNWLGVEVKRSRCVWIEEKLIRSGVPNVRMMTADALRELPVLSRPGSVDAIHVNFFDPWPRDRHIRRRFARPSQANACAQLLKVGGELYFVTDHEARALEAREVFSAHPFLENTWGEANLTDRIPEYVQTIHEIKFRKRGRQIHFLRYRRRA